MASRLYRITRQLYLAIEHCLRRLRVHDLGSPTLLVLMTWTVTGLLLLDARPTHTRVARVLPGRCHDALGRLLRTMSWSTRALTTLLIAFATRLGRDGYLVLDEVIVEKAFAKRLPWAARIYSFANKRTVWGFQIVVLVWCSCDGQWRIPVGFRLWRPKRSCRRERYRTKLELALDLVTAVVLAKLPATYIVGDTHYTAGWFTKRLTRLGLTWHGTLDPKTHVVWRGEKQAVRELAMTLKLKWRQHLSVRAMALTVYAPKYGQLRLVVTRNRHGNYEYLVSNDRTLDLTTMVRRKRSRWSVETVFRDSKQCTGLEACQCWSNQALVRHVALVFLTFVVLQLLRATPHESVGAVKERWQLAVIRDGEVPSPPLRACPPELRSTA
ncbi:MAG: transposase [Chloroflexota bacterium]|nr:transposase [Chloroflexota bacterium]